jgi:hypothetical protein
MFSLSCSLSNTVVTPYSDIYGHSFSTFGVRAKNLSDWSTVSGTYKLAFAIDASQARTVTGTFSNFAVSGMCPYLQTCSCTGTFTANISDTAIDDSVKPYTVFNTNQAVTQDAAIQTFGISLTITSSDMSASCASQSDRPITVYLDQNNSIVVLDGTQYFEMNPI